MTTARILINIYDGRRQPFPAKAQTLVRIRDGDQHEVFSDFVTGPTLFADVPFYDNLRDNYTVLASSTGCVDAGYFPVKVSPKLIRPVFLMLLPRDGRFNFSGASWKQLRGSNRRLFDLFSKGEANATRAQKRYEDCMEDHPENLACLFNIVTVMRDIHLSEGVVLDYLRALQWDRLQQDRFFAYADSVLLEQVRLAADQGAFAQEPSPGLLHPGATCSYKQIQFGEANVQITFHEKDPAPGGASWVSIEPDIDYYKDLGGHALLEVLPGFFPAGLTDPKRVYVLRWIAGHQANVAEFSPPYTIQA